MEQKKLPIGITHFLVIALIIASFAIGSLWTKVQYLEQASGTGRVAGVQANNTNDNAPAAQPPTQEAGEVAPLVDDDHVRGDRKARILLIEYSDFQCPYCQRFHPTAKQVLATYKNDLAWVYRHFPLDSIHPLARNAAYAVECAYQQGKDEAFWQFADKLFEVTPAIGEEELPKLATSVGLDENKLTECMKTDAAKERIERDLASGTKAGITGTPGNILLDTKTKKTRLIPGAVPFESIKQSIDELLNNTE